MIYFSHGKGNPKENGMILLSNRPHTLYSKEKANENVTILTANEDDPAITYVANHNPKGTGYSFIEVFEDGVKIFEM